MNLHRRLEALERKVQSNPITLTMADGSVRVLHYSSEGLLNLFTRSMQQLAVGIALSGDAKLIADAVSIHEPDGHMCELFAALANSPQKSELGPQGVL